MSNLSSIPLLKGSNAWNFSANAGFGYQYVNNNLLLGVLSQFNYFGDHSNSTTNSFLGENITNDHYSYSVDLDGLIGYNKANFSAYAGLGGSFINQNNDTTASLSGVGSVTQGYTNSELAFNVMAAEQYYFDKNWGMYLQYEHVFADNAMSLDDYANKLAIEGKMISSINSVTLGVVRHF